MEIRVSGHQMDTGEALRAHVSERMNTIAEKYFSRAIGAHATFGKGPHDSFHCDIVTHVMQGLVLKGHGDARDAHVAFESAADRIEKQLRRYMRRLKDRHANGGSEAKNVEYIGETIDDNATYTILDAGLEDEEVGNAPAIIAETRVDIPTISVSDAVMMLDFRNTNALLFVNSKSRDHNMVYRRKDGAIGWVEPQMRN